MVSQEGATVVSRNRSAKDILKSGQILFPHSSQGDSVPLEETPDAVPGADPDPVPGADPGQASAETGVPLSGGSLLGDQIITRVFSSSK